MQATKIFVGASLIEGEAELLLGVERGRVELARRFDDRMRNVIVVHPHDLGPGANRDGIRLEGEVVDGELGFAGRRECAVDSATYRRARRECAEAVVNQRHLRVPLFARAVVRLTHLSRHDAVPWPLLTLPARGGG